ncbi:MAG: hypothetical protein ACXVD4_14855 [Nocardioides sp.]
MTRLVAAARDTVAQSLMLDRFQRPYRRDPWFVAATALSVLLAVGAAVDRDWRDLLAVPFAYFWVGLVDLVVENVRGPRRRAG